MGHGKAPLIVVKTNQVVSTFREEKPYQSLILPPNIYRYFKMDKVSYCMPLPCCVTIEFCFLFVSLPYQGIIATYLDFDNFLVCISPINIRFGSGLPPYLLILTFLPTVCVLICHLSSNKAEFTLELRLLFSSSVPFSQETFAIL